MLTMKVVIIFSVLSIPLVKPSSSDNLMSWKKLVQSETKTRDPPLSNKLMWKKFIQSEIKNKRKNILMLSKTFVQNDTTPKLATPSFEKHAHAQHNYVRFDRQKWEDLNQFRSFGSLIGLLIRSLIFVQYQLI